MQNIFVRRRPRGSFVTRRCVCAVVPLAAAFIAGACTDGPTQSSPDGRKNEPLYQVPGVATETCQNGGVYPECSSSDSNTGGDPTPVVPASGGSSDGTTSTDSTQTNKPCNTGDPVLDDPQVQAGFQDLWARSNPDAEMSQRLEKGGWIMQTATGYTIQPFPDDWTIGSCGIDLPPDALPPAGAIGWVHTHPFTKGDRNTACDTLTFRLPNGQTVTYVQKYENNPSDYDGVASIKFGFGGYIMDKDKITEFIGDRYNQPDNYTVTNQVNRCGY